MRGRRDTLVGAWFPCRSGVKLDAVECACVALLAASSFFVSASCGACEGLGCVHGVCVLDAACSFLSLGATSLPSCRAGRLSRLLVISCHTLCALRLRALMFHASP